MCEIDWNIAHKFVDTLIWPIFFAVILWMFRNQVNKLLNRITEESKKIEIPGVFTATLKQVEEIKKRTKESGEELPEETQRLISSTVAVQIESIKDLGEEYISANFDQRRIIENRIKDLSIGLTVDDLTQLFNSKNTGHRISAAIVLDTIAYKSGENIGEDDRVIDFLKESLEDSSSFLRHEAIQVILSSPTAIKKLKGKLEKMKSSDDNEAIRNLLKLYSKSFNT